MLTAQEITEARVDYAQTFLTQQCTIRRAEPGIPDGYGGRSQRSSVAYMGVPCRVQRAQRPQVIESGYQSTSLYDWEVLLPVGFAVQLEDRIECEGSTYEVKGSNVGMSEALCLTAYCTRAN
jgi:hypothetical protein